MSWQAETEDVVTELQRRLNRAWQDADEGLGHLPIGSASYYAAAAYADGIERALNEIDAMRRESDQ